VQQELDASQLDRGALWTEFQELAARSDHALALEYLVQLGQRLPVRDRTAIALAVTHLLAPAEWPRAWDAPRSKLVSALDELLMETDSLAPGSLFRAPGASSPHLGDATTMAFCHALLVLCRDLLRVPCARAEVRYVARLCNMAIRVYEYTYRIALEMEDVALDELKATRLRYAIAYQKYAQAARELNDACGVVLFEALDTPLEGQER
jgi:hypothetical protein